MSLTDEILDNISAYRMSGILAEEEVIRAHMEACLHDIRVHEECESMGIIMEGDIIPERNGENIFKYLLLFIPRLIINLMRKLMEWITGTHVPTQEEIKKAQEELRKKTADDARYLYLCKLVADSIDREKSKRYPSATGEFKWDGDYVYLTTEYDVTDLEPVKVFNKYREFFESYKKTFETISESGRSFSVDDELSKFNEELMTVFYGGRDDLDVTPGNYYKFEIDPKACDDIITEINKHRKTIEKLMTDIQSIYYNKIQGGKKISPLAVNFATSVESKIEKVYNDYIKFNKKITDDIGAARWCYSQIKPTIKNIYEKFEDDQELLKERGFIDGD